MHPINRKDLLCKFFRNELSETQIKNLQTQLPCHYHLIYTLFNILREGDADKEDVVDAMIVEGDVKLNLTSKSIAKLIEKADEHYTFGGKTYKMKVKRVSNVVVVSSKCIIE